MSRPALVLFDLDDVLVGYDHWKERVVADGAPGSVTIATTPNVYDYNGGAPLPSFIARQNYNKREVTQNAVYAVGRFSLADPLKLILGARMVDYEVVDLKTPANSYSLDNEVVPYAGLVLDFDPHDWANARLEVAQPSMARHYR